MPTMITSLSIKITSLPAIAWVLFVFCLSAAPAEAQANRTFVSGKGTDAGACTLAAPCRSFAFALIQTNAGGEIDVLDPAGYDFGTVTITRRSASSTTASARPASSSDRAGRAS